MAEAFWRADIAADGDLRRYLDFRCSVVTSLVAEIRQAVRPDVDVAVIPSVARPTGGAWYEGSDLAALAETAGIIEACFYEPSAMRVKSDLFDIRRRTRGVGRLRGILRPRIPTSPRRASSWRRSQRCARAASTSSPSTTGDTCAAPILPGSAMPCGVRHEPVLRRQDGRDHRRRGRHRPLALPLLRRGRRDGSPRSTATRPSRRWSTNSARTASK